MTIASDLSWDDIVRVGPGTLGGNYLRQFWWPVALCEPALPEVPTISEAGVAGYDSLSWSGFAVPAATPRDVVLRLNRETAAILATADMKQKLGEQGADAIGGPPEAFAAHVRAEREKWGRLVRERNIVIN